MNRHRWTLLIIALVTLCAGWVSWPQNPGSYLPGGDNLPGNSGLHLRFGQQGFDRQGARLGLDLQGGTQLVLLSDLSKVDEGDRSNALNGVVQVIERRVNAYGVAEPLIQIQGNDRVIVELPARYRTEDAT